MHLAK